MSRKTRRNDRKDKIAQFEQGSTTRKNNRNKKVDKNYNEQDDATSKFVYKPSNIIPKTEAQDKYLRALRDEDITLVVSHGSAGTGKTFLAATAAIDGLLQGKYKKIILTRPLTECSDTSKIGFLKGDLSEKIKPYMIPVLEVFAKRVGASKVEYMMEKGIIEMTAVELARGRDFEDSFILVDEAQNLSTSQFFLMLSRVNEGSKIVVDGDIGQADIPNSGLADCIHRMGTSDATEVIQFTSDDCVRSGFCRDVIRRYGK